MYHPRSTYGFASRGIVHSSMFETGGYYPRERWRAATVWARQIRPDWVGKARGESPAGDRKRAVRRKKKPQVGFAAALRSRADRIRTCDLLVPKQPDLVPIYLKSLGMEAL